MGVASTGGSYTLVVAWRPHTKFQCDWFLPVKTTLVGVVRIKPHPLPNIYLILVELVVFIYLFIYLYVHDKLQNG